MGKHLKEDEFDFFPSLFDRLTLHQKLAVLDFLSVIAASAVNPNKIKAMSDFISHYYKEFKVTGDQYLAYIAIGGRNQTYIDIGLMDKRLIQDLVFATAELCICGGEVEDEQLLALSYLLESVGISLVEWNDYMDNPRVFDL